MESFGLLREGQPINILKQEGLRTSLFEHPEVGRQGVGAWVVEAESIATCPITGLGERLAGGATDQEVSVAGFETTGGKELLGRQVEDTPLDDRATGMLSKRLAAIGIEVRGDGAVKPGGLDAVIEAAAAAVQADRGWSAHQWVSETAGCIPQHRHGRLAP